jgi:heavy metal sensor kinase
MCGTLIASAVLLAASGLALYGSARSMLQKHFDAEMTDEAEELAVAFPSNPDGTRLESMMNMGLHAFGGAEGGYIEVWDRSGAVVFRSKSLAGQDLQRLPTSRELPSCYWTSLPDGRELRATCVVFAPDTGSSATRAPAAVLAEKGAAGQTGTITLVLAHDMKTIKQALRRLVALIVGMGLIVMTAAAIIIWLLIKVCLRPLDNLAEQIGRIGDEDLDTRIAERHVPHELQPIQNGVNGLLERLSRAFQRERAFSADVAHELRTPLSGLHSIADVTLSKPRRPPEYEQALRACLQITSQMEAVVHNLLFLARLEMGQVDATVEAVRLNDLIRDCWQPFIRRAEERRLRVSWTLNDLAPFATSPTLLRQVISNILENAVSYADEKGAMRVACAVSRDQAQIEVANSGSGLSQEQAEQAFNRFWRGDPTRSSSGASVGLGLTLVKRAVAVLGGKVQVRSSVGGEFMIAVTIPSH